MDEGDYYAQEVDRLPVMSGIGISEQAAVFASILGQKPPTSSTADNPVLSRRPGLLKAPSEEALDRQARAQLRRERHALLASLRVRPNPSQDLARERGLRKAATQGVVQLFNAVWRHQQSRDATSSEGQRHKPAGATCTPATATPPCKPDFMDLLRTGPSKII